MTNHNDEEDKVCKYARSLTLLVTQQFLLRLATKAFWQLLTIHKLMQDVEVCLAQEPDLGLHPVIHKHLQHLPDCCKHQGDVDQKHPAHQLLQHCKMLIEQQVATDLEMKQAYGQF